MYSDQSRMKRYCFNRSQFNSDLHEVKNSDFPLWLETGSDTHVICKHMQNSDACMNKALSDLMNDECMSPTPEEAAMLNWLNPNARFPIALNSDDLSFASG